MNVPGAFKPVLFVVCGLESLAALGAELTTLPEA